MDTPELPQRPWLLENHQCPQMRTLCLNFHTKPEQALQLPKQRAPTKHDVTTLDLPEKSNPLRERRVGIEQIMQSRELSVVTHT
jgi:hypothetical protein